MKKEIFIVILITFLIAVPIYIRIFLEYEYIVNSKNPFQTSSTGIE